MIEDQELLDIYQTSSEAHLQKLATGLLELEQNPSDLQLLDELLEEIKSLKQDSIILEVESVATLADCVEEILRQVKNQEISFSLQVKENLNLALESMIKLAKEAIDGTPSEVNVLQVVQNVTNQKEDLLAEIFEKDFLKKKEEEQDDFLAEILAEDFLRPKDKTEINGNGSKIIEDLELRDIYQVSSEQHLEKLAAGLLELEQNPGDQKRLEELLTEVQGLKQDSTLVEGEKNVVALADYLAEILTKIKNDELVINPEVSVGLHQGLDAIVKLVEESITGIPSGVDVELLLQELTGEFVQSEATENEELELWGEVETETPLALSTNNEELELWGEVETETPLAMSTNVVEIIEDEELREIYKTSSEEHLQVLEAGLLGLEKNPEAINKIEELLREAHSLKGDSRIVGVESVEQIAHGIEDILKSIENQEITFTSAISDRLYGALDAMKLLVKAAVTGNPSGVELSKILASLQVRESEAPAPLKEEKIVPVIKIIEDEELREIYKTSCEEHLEKLEAGLLHLEKHPDDLERLEELMREAHSLKGDSRITEVESVEQLAQAVEDIFRSITKQELELTAKLSDRLDQVFNGMKKLVEEAVTGNPPQVNVSEMLTELRGEKFNVLSKKPAVEHKQQKNLVKTPESTHHIDTIRIQTRELDALMTQAGELTVTKIRIGHFASEMETAASLWEDWKNNRQQDQTISSEEKLEKLLSQLKNTAQENSARLDLISGELESKIRTLRLLPLATVFNLFPRMVRDLAKEEGKEVELIIEGGETTADKQILEEIKDPLMHMVRNAIDHGIETPEEREKLGKQRQATLRLRGYQIGNKIHIEVIDDGRGLEIEKIKQTALMRGICRPEELETMTESQLHHLIFVPGFSTKNFITEVSGRGVGLDVVRTNVERLKGNIEIESVFTQGCTFRIKLGTTLATANVLLVEVEGIVHALPLEVVQSNLLIKPEQIFTIEGRQTISLNNQAISVANLAELLQLSPMNGNKNKRSVRPCVLLNVGEEQLGVFVERVLDIQDVVIKPQSKLLKRVRNVSGATILGTGEVCMILNPQDLLASVHNGKNTTNFFERRITETEEKTKPVVLLADDSIAVRTQEKRILDGAGYEVITAVDGLDALNKLKTRDFDAVISDIQMPNLDGFLLTAKIRQHPEYNELPVILVTSLSSDEDKRKGVEVGANAYIVKGNFNQDILLETLGRLV